VMKKKVLVLGFILFFVNISLSDTLKKKITVSLEEKKIQDLSPSGFSVVFYINVSNSSSKAYYLSNYDYRFMVNDKQYIIIDSNLEEAIRIDAKGRTSICLPVKITYSHLFQEIEGIESEEKAFFYLMGGLTFSEHGKRRGRIPIAFSGEIPIFNGLDINFMQLRENSLSFTGADLNFYVKFKNTNTFNILVEKASYNLVLGGYSIGNGVIREEKEIEKAKEGAFSIPLLLNFFEVGKDLYAVLQQKTVTCRFSGQMEVYTRWGRFAIPFEKNEKIAIVRSSS